MVVNRCLTYPKNEPGRLVQANRPDLLIGNSTVGYGARMMISLLS
jgi:hypothetical protein